MRSILVRLRLRRTGKWLAAVVYTVLLVLLIVAAWFLVRDLSSIWGEEGANYSALVQSAVYSLAILAAGAVAIYRFQVFRDLEPHLTISHKITHRPVGNNYVHIFVAATLRNSSKVEVDIRRELFRVQQIAPVEEDELNRLVKAVFPGGSQAVETAGDEKEIQWPTIDEVYRAWGPNELIVEPGEAHQETVEFVVPASVQTALIYTYFFNTQFYPGSRSAQGWGVTSVYDIIKPAQPHETQEVRSDVLAEEESQEA